MDEWELKCGCGRDDRSGGAGDVCMACGMKVDE